MNDIETQLRTGYISFSRADIAQSIDTGATNKAAYQLMMEATRANNGYTTRKGEPVNEIYPLTADAAEAMRQKLSEAEQAADNPKDEVFQLRLKELKRIACWSAKTQKSWSWMIVIGGVLWVAFYLLTTVVLAGPDYSKRQAQVETWTDTPPSYAIDEVKDKYSLRADKYGCATNYKLSCLIELANAYFRVKHTYEETGKTLRYGTLSDTNREVYTHNLTVLEKELNEAKANFEAANAQPSDYWQQKALDEVGGGVKGEKKRNAFLYLIAAYFVVITVLYIYTNRPKGYMLSRQRATARVTGGMTKVMFGILSWLGISAARMGWTDPDKIVTIFWSDGSITKYPLASDLINGMAMFKLIFYAAALTFLMFGSAYLLPILTIIGFFINIDRKR